MWTVAALPGLGGAGVFRAPSQPVLQVSLGKGLTLPEL